MSNGWLGGTKYRVDNMNSESVTLSNSDMGYYYWAYSPESVYNPDTGLYGSASPTNSVFYNKIKYDGAESSVTVRYNYAPWDSLQPDNVTDEGCMSIFRDTGKWNDFPPTYSSIQGYTIEYGDSLHLQKSYYYRKYRR